MTHATSGAGVRRRVRNQRTLRQLLGGRELPAIRAELGKTQADVAAALGVKRQAVQGWEVGSSLPRPALLLQLRELIEVHQEET